MDKDMKREVMRAERERRVGSQTMVGGGRSLVAMTRGSERGKVEIRHGFPFEVASDHDHGHVSFPIDIRPILSVRSFSERVNY